MTTLLEKALALPTRKNKPIEKEHVELAIGWAEGRVTGKQLAQALGLPKGSRASVYNFLAMALRQAWLDRNLKDGGKP